MNKCLMGSIDHYWRSMDTIAPSSMPIVRSIIVLCRYLNYILYCWVIDVCFICFCLSYAL